MQLDKIKEAKLKNKKRQIGRGGKRGVYSGRGIKGQGSRAGTHKKAPITKNLIKRYPKLRGHGAKMRKIIQPLTIVNVSILNDKFNQDELVTPQILYQKGIIRKIKGKIPQVKILGTGELKKKIKIENCLVSKSVKEKLEILNKEEKRKI
jgi:large subunit ribosomal protein L15